jgi:hypothetical protein
MDHEGQIYFTAQVRLPPDVPPIAEQRFSSQTLIPWVRRAWMKATSGTHRRARLSAAILNNAQLL